MMNITKNDYYLVFFSNFLSNNSKLAIHLIFWGLKFIPHPYENINRTFFIEFYYSYLSEY